MQVLYQRCAAVDVGKDVIAVAVRLPGDGPDGRQIIKRTFKTFYGVLAEAARWLSGLGVTHVAMEATGIYSMPVYHALIEHGDFTQVLVCNAGHVKNVPGRKTDLADADWLVHLLECGLLAGSFIPPADIKAARTSSGTAPRSCSPGPQRCKGSATCSRTPGSRSTRWPPRSPPSPGGR
jgi:hypothetical protein